MKNNFDGTLFFSKKEKECLIIDDGKIIGKGYNMHSTGGNNEAFF